MSARSYRSEARTGSAAPSHRSSSTSHHSSDEQLEKNNVVLFDKRLSMGNPLHKPIYTGPDGMDWHRYPVTRDPQFVGIGSFSPEKTCQISYLSRNPVNMPFPKAKNGRIGEIGWPVDYFGVVKGV
ncbi:uncharacterized protein LOC106164698 [Lingula anatina]|uniref:Uncharacterized protein LOC106164698 n=1 Tax=Lingula anatina TaxID=7574 RepID=A0A1S3IKV8_LINAN|nr:uncharacterized protein LOC106164698 [Lingula anatina]XP_013398154.1 uncharacterized protein LOC106164698 [Lingula anatina]|eukprot:XP_013398152.1 uncharacterized protein LOC106164698 [Lingula anatina]